MMKKFSVYIFFGFSLFLTSCEMQKPAKTVYIEDRGPVKINSIEEAKKHAVGIWTYTEPSLGWFKYIINVDGTYIKHVALPADDDWGEASDTGKWEVFTNKYMNTGERFYGINFLDDGDYRSIGSIFKNSNSLSMVDPYGQPIYTLKKGDKFPFSK